MKMLKFQVDFDVYAGPPVAVIISDDDHHHHKSGFSVNLHVLGFLVAGALFLFISLWFLCCYCVKIEQARLRFHNMFQRVEVVIDEEQVLQVEEDDDDPVDHPIWYIRTQGLQQSVVDSIMVVKYRKDEGLVEGSDCSICLSEFEEDESLRLLPKCAHAFHVPCIDQWFRSHKNCPLCRAPVAHLVVAGPPMLPATAEEDRGESEEEEENDGEMATVDVNISVEDSDSAESENGAKKESCLGESHRVQAVRRWVSAGPVTASKMYGALTEIKIQADSSSSSVQMMRSASYGGKPSSAAGRSKNTTLSN